MRKIIPKHKQNKKDKIKQFGVATALVFVMIISVLGYSFSFSRQTEQSPDKRIIYNGFEFVKENGLWMADIKGLQFSFRYNPKQTKDLENIDFIIKDINDYYNQPLYIYSENTEAETEIYRNLDQVVLRRQYACLEEKCIENFPNFPIKTCEDNFIIIEKSEDAGIKQNQSCIFIQGKQEDLTKLTDRFLFEILGVQ